MKTRFYIPWGKDLPPSRWLPELSSARSIAQGMAATGRECFVTEVRVTGTDTDILLALHRWCMEHVGILPEKEVAELPDIPGFQCNVYERHEPTEQIPLPGDAVLFQTRVVPAVLPEENRPKKKPATRKKRSTKK